MRKQTEVEQAVAKIYSAMLDNIALSQHQLYIQDVMTYGTGAMKFNEIDGRARHCAIHGCPHCTKRLKTRLERGVWIDAAVLAVILVAGVAVTLLLKRWLQ